MGGCCRLCACGPVVSLSIIGALSYSTVWFGWRSPVATILVEHGRIELVAFILEVSFLLLSYFLVVLGGPGKTPPNWVPAEADLAEHHLTEGRELPLNVESLRAEDLLQFCHICECYKPPRTHHCRECNTCVPGMDHHCPWTNQCIGYRNMKA